MKSVYIAYSQGCPRSAVDAALLFRYFTANRWRTKCAIGEADLVLISACGVHEEAEKLGLASIATLDGERRRDSKLVVLGCVAGIDPDGILERFDAVLLPPVRIHEMDSLIDATVPLRAIEDPNLVRDAVKTARANLAAVGNGHDARASRTRRAVRQLRRRLRISPEGPAPMYSLRVAWGCRGECTYCAIRHAAGPLRSKPLGDVLAEYDRGLEQGHREFELVAGDVGCYGQDLGTSSVELLREIFARPGSFKLTIHDFNPEYLVAYRDELVPLLSANSARIRMLVLPLQSGSDRVLRLMRRDYAAADVVACMQELRAAADPPLNVVTHVLAGFPGESEEDFARTLDALRRARFDRVDVYHYTPRPNTESLQLPDPVPTAVAEHRAALVAKEFNARFSLWPKAPATPLGI